MYIGSDFGTNYVRGQDIASVTADQTHLAGASTDHRGNLSWSQENYPFLGSTAGTAALIARDDNGVTYGMNIFGIDTNGDVTGAKDFAMPATVTDNADGFASLGTDEELTHYHSQVAFSGGNGQVALGQDQAGRLITAATADQPGPAGASGTTHFIAVARIDPVTGVAEWTMAAHNDGGGAGKDILDGPGGTKIGNLTDYQTAFGASLPSMSAPMIDGVGNIYFVSVLDMSASGSGFTVGLVRAVYDPTSFSYELELLFRSGLVLDGQNSALKYQIQFFSLNDSNSISSAAPWSQNISQNAHMSMCPEGLTPSDPRSLGGLVISVEIVYDYDGDTSYTPCTGASGDPLSPDQDYNVLLYVGATNAMSDLDGNGIADEAEMLSGDNVSVSVAGGGSQILSLCAGVENAGRVYAFAGSVTGTSPGFPFAGLLIPLNFDFYTLLLINSGFLGSTPFGASFSGVLDAEGKATAVWTVPPIPGLAGVTAHHAFGIFNPLPKLSDISNPWPLSINP